MSFFSAFITALSCFTSKPRKFVKNDIPYQPALPRVDPPAQVSEVNHPCQVSAEPKTTVAPPRRPLMPSEYEDDFHPVHYPETKLVKCGDINAMRKLKEMKKPNSDFVEMDFGPPSVSQTQRNLEKKQLCKWLHDNASRSMAEKVLEKNGLKNGSWLMTKNSAEFSIYIVEDKKVVKIPVRLRKSTHLNTVYHIDMTKCFGTLHELVMFYRFNPITPKLAVLKTPVFSS